MRKALGRAGCRVDFSCRWSENEDGNWDTDCGECFVFETDGPKENRAKWCPYCGRRIEPVGFFQQNVKSGGTERMSQNQKRDVVEVASRDLLAVLEILNAFDYEADEDSCMGMSFFTGRISEDGFFITKRRLEAALKAHQDSLANAQGQTRRKDGWIPHTPGDPMPCNPGTSVLIRLGDQSEFFTEFPEKFVWQEIPDTKGAEIIAWKPSK